jgi:hypothetical protein
MSHERLAGEPMSAGRGSRSGADRQGLIDALIAASAFAGIVLVGGLLATFLIELIEALSPPATSAVDIAMRDAYGKSTAPEMPALMTDGHTRRLVLSGTSPKAAIGILPRVGRLRRRSSHGPKTTGPSGCGPAGSRQRPR